MLISPFDGNADQLRISEIKLCSITHKIRSIKIQK